MHTSVEQLAVIAEMRSYLDSNPEERNAIEVLRKADTLRRHHEQVQFINNVGFSQS